ncbi:hypothetical protein PYCCODRAFT_1471315 [Trametes coccinea BRFM310]|uniref:Uncharacterized protein n=1 Tax=Trametes coccinea (strain BRFM310) TaxID=1353009 RepID=A0A1Y2IAF9_TRAC3|nr:hypothetical protein PYCCODRAFT_1471315 [Trametes coccinea BRFM310]
MLLSDIDETVSLIYQIELGFESLEAYQVDGLSSSELLERLLDRRVRWLTLDWSFVESLRAEEAVPQSNLPYDLKNGTFLNITNHARIVTMNTIILPTRADPQPRYTNRPLVFIALGVTTDPTQDLLVVLDVGGRINLGSLSTRMGAEGADHNLELEDRPYDHRPNRYMGFVHTHHLMTYLDARAVGEPPRLVPWSQWGPKNNRFEPHYDPLVTSARNVHGQRAVFSRKLYTLRYHRLSVYDFNVHPRRVQAARRYAQDNVPVRSVEVSRGDDVDCGQRRVHVRVVTVPTIVSPDWESESHPFLETVENSLPYIETITVVKGGTGRNVQYIMDDERLIEFNPL